MTTVGFGVFCLPETGEGRNRLLNKLHALRISHLCLTELNPSCNQVSLGGGSARVNGLPLNAREWLQAASILWATEIQGFGVDGPLAGSSSSCYFF